MTLWLCMSTRMLPNFLPRRKEKSSIPSSTTGSTDSVGSAMMRRRMVIGQVCIPNRSVKRAPSMPPVASPLAWTLWYRRVVTRAASVQQRPSCAPRRFSEHTSSPHKRICVRVAAGALAALHTADRQRGACNGYERVLPQMSKVGSKQFSGLTPQKWWVHHQFSRCLSPLIPLARKETPPFSSFSDHLSTRVVFSL